MNSTFTPTPNDATRIFRLIASKTPGFTSDESRLSKVQFSGEPFPVIPGPIKWVAVTAALHTMAGVLADEILEIRGEKDANRKIKIDITHTALSLATVISAFLDGKDLLHLMENGEANKLTKDWEHGWTDTPPKYRATGLYPTSDPTTFYSLHGSLDPVPVLQSIGIGPNNVTVSSVEEAAALISEHTRKFSPTDLELINLKHGFSGTVCFTPEQWNSSAIGKSLAAHPLVNVKEQTHVVPTPPVTFAPLNHSDKRPLAGVKFVDFTRVIAGPELSATLTAFGAEVIRFHAPHLRDVNAFQLTLNSGKRTSTIDLRKESDLQLLHGLLADADVFIQGFRAGKMKKYGLGLEELLEMAGKRGQGIIYVSENCYGPDGYYKERPGWQQIADGASGAATVIGKALEATQNLPKNEAVLPCSPIADMTTGVLGAVGTLLAIRDRATKGGSYEVNASLVAVDTYALRKEVGLIPLETVQECQDRFEWNEMRGSHHVSDLLVTIRIGWQKVLGNYLEENSGLFQSFETSAFDGKRLSVLKPVVQIDGPKGPKWSSPSIPYGSEELEGLEW